MTTFKDIALLIARILIGIVMIAHGWQKFTEWGITGTAETFTSLGVPFPTLSALAAAIIELGTGILLLIGLITRWAGLLLVLDMVGGFLFAHMGNGVFIDNGGFELVASIAAVSLALSAAGAGRFSIDYMISTRRQAANYSTEPLT